MVFRLTRRLPTARLFGLGTGLRSFDRILALGFLIVLLLVRLWDPTPMRTLRLNAFDFYQRLAEVPERPRAVMIVDIDERSLARIGQWPWPRSVLAKLVRNIADKGAAAIAFDMIFAEPDRTSPDVYAKTIEALPNEVRRVLAKLPNNDAVFAGVLSQLPVVLAQAVQTKAAAGGAGKSKSSFAFLGGQPHPFLLSSPGVLRNLPSLENAARGVGLISYFPEVDGLVRRVPALFLVGKEIKPALSVELLRVATGTNTIVVKTDSTGVRSLVLAGVEIPTDSQGVLWVRSRPHDPKRYISAADVLDGKVPRARLAGRLVLIGTSATALLDLRSTPLERSIPGVEVHAQLIENIMFKTHISRPFYADGLEFFSTILISLVLIVLVPKMGALRVLIVGYIIIFLFAVAAWYAFQEEGLLIDLTFPAIASFAIFASMSFANYLREERGRRQVRAAFGQYLSPALVDQLADNPDQLVLGGEMRELTLMFGDVRGFTTISEKFDAEELTEFVNSLFTPIGDIILNHGGTIDKYIGDSVMAYWNAPIDDEDHATNAARAALDILDGVDRFNEDFPPAQSGEPGVRFGIGLNTGICCVGNMGSSQRFDYSAIGDAVNVASRLEGETKRLGVDIVVADATQQLIPDFALLELGEITVRGRVEPVTIFALLGDEKFAEDPDFRKLRDLNGAIAQAIESGDTARALSLIGEARALKIGRLARYLDRLEAEAQFSDAGTEKPDGAKPGAAAEAGSGQEDST